MYTPIHMYVIPVRSIDVDGKYNTVQCVHVRNMRWRVILEMNLRHGLTTDATSPLNSLRILTLINN